MKEFFKRLTNRVVIGQIFSMIFLIITIAGIKVEEIDTWVTLWNVILQIISNPFVIGNIIYQIWAGTNNPTNKNGY